MRSAGGRFSQHCGLSDPGNKRRALIAYFAGLGVTLMANVLRISLLVIFGNRASTEWIMRQHVNAGWAVFTVAFLTFLTLTYNWMLQPKQALST